MITQAAVVFLASDGCGAIRITNASMTMTARDVYASGFDEANGKTTDADACPECDGSLTTGAGEIRGTDCGLIGNEYRVDHGSAYFRFGDRPDKREQTGAPLTPARHDQGLSTEIDNGVDGKGKPLPGSKRRRLGRLRTQHSRAKWRSKGERNLGHACSEIAQVARCDEDNVRLGYRVLNVELGLEAAPVHPTDLVPRLASDCDAMPTIKHRALELARMAKKPTLANGRKPSGVAAACPYTAGLEHGLRFTQTELADIAGVTPVTIRAR